MKEKSYQAGLRSLQIEAEAIHTIYTRLEPTSFAAAVDALSRAQDVVTCASGNSGIAAKKFAHCLCCIEKKGYFLSPADAVHGGLGCVSAASCVVLVSRGGKTRELLPIAETCKQRKAFVLLLTEQPNAPLAAFADCVLPFHVATESDKYNIMATASFVVTVALFDALLCALIEEEDFQLQQFAQIHPGGAVGEKLNP